MVYENKEDRDKERYAIRRVRGFLKEAWKGKVSCRQTGTLSHEDFIVICEEDTVGIGEVKSRNYPTIFFKEHGWIMENARMDSLRARARKLEVDLILLVLHTSDKDVFVVSEEKLAHNKNQLKPSSGKMMKDDHGRTGSKKKGFIIPFKLLTKTQEN